MSLRSVLRGCQTRTLNISIHFPIRNATSGCLLVCVCLLKHYLQLQESQHDKFVRGSAISFVD